jgi:biopolymer transport protein ExbB
VSNGKQTKSINVSSLSARITAEEIEAGKFRCQLEDGLIGNWHLDDKLVHTNASTVDLEIPTVGTLSVLDLIAGGGIFIMGPLGILSVIAIYIFIERFLAIQKAQSLDPSFMNKMKDFIHEGKMQSAQDLCKKTTTPFARMLLKGVNRIGKPLSDISASIENVGKLEIYNLEKSLSTLATIAGAAPMIGFLGTVIGMINTFHEMYSAGNSVEISNLSGGIMQAMVTTAAG